MFREITKKIQFGSEELTIKTGKIARLADSSVTVQMGDTIVLVTACIGKKPVEGCDFILLSVHYREMLFSAGKIPGGFIKREGKPSDAETLISRLIDRSIRPLFPDCFHHEIQVVCTVLSYDPRYSPDVLAIIGASAAISLSSAPVIDIIGSAKVGIIDGEFVLNPSYELLKQSKLDIVVSGTKSSIMMVESESEEIHENKIVEAIRFAHESFQDVISGINALVSEVGKPKINVTPKDRTLTTLVEESYKEKIRNCFAIKGKLQRQSSFDELEVELIQKYADQGYDDKSVLHALESVKYSVLRAMILDDKIRIDGRSPQEIRNISCETSLLPRTHGSALFTRGETQALVVTTLGSAADEQIIDGLDKSSKEPFILHYIFPPYSVGETTPVKAPGRREIGHGKLAWRAINPMLPEKTEFPYTIRVVSEITESNGSSSMATVCGTSLSLMDAGVPIKAPVSGIAMGLIKEGDKYAILSDILGDEDFLGDMDFKVAGTAAGITALQMDIKINGINFEIITKALEQAHVGRMHILEIMNNTMSQHKSSLSEYSPRIETIKIDKDKIKDIIGPGGKVIKEICESLSVKIDIEEDGTVQVAASGSENLRLALNRIKIIAQGPEVGSIVSGKVTKVLDFGAFVSVNYVKEDGLVHISEISDERVEDISKHLKIGDIVQVKIIGTDHKGKMKLSIKAAKKDLIS